MTFTWSVEHIVHMMMNDVSHIAIQLARVNLPDFVVIRKPTNPICLVNVFIAQ
ncbi:hypothetical protein D3C72_2417580 [compost metagenome]